MTDVVTENRIRCKYTDCVEVRPVGCFGEGETMLVGLPGAARSTQPPVRIIRMAGRSGARHSTAVLKENAHV